MGMVALLTVYVFFLLYPWFKPGSFIVSRIIDRLIVWFCFHLSVQKSHCVENAAWKSQLRQSTRQPYGRRKPPAQRGGTA
jgi:hypothetical protein